MGSLDCCLKARLQINVDEWLISESQVEQFWLCRMRLFRCPSCQQLWIWRSELVGHKEWDQTWTKADSNLFFSKILEEQLAADQKRQSELKTQYEMMGLEWPSGRRL
jgi:hypothetical protein